MAQNNEQGRELTSNEIVELLINNFNDYQENIQELLIKNFDKNSELKKSWSDWFKGVNQF